MKNKSGKKDKAKKKTRRLKKTEENYKYRKKVTGKG